MYRTFAGRGGGGVTNIFSNVYIVDSRNLKFPYHPLLFAHADLNATNSLGQEQLLYVKLTISLWNLLLIYIPKE